MENKSVLTLHELEVVYDRIYNEFILANDRTIISEDDHGFRGRLVNFFIDLTDTIPIDEFFYTDHLVSIWEKIMNERDYLTHRALYNLTTRLCVVFATDDLGIDRLCSTVVNAYCVPEPEKSTCKKTLNVWKKGNSEDLKHMLLNARVLMIVYCIMLTWPSLHNYYVKKSTNHIA